MNSVRFTKAHVVTLANPDGTRRKITYSPGDILDGLTLDSVAAYTRRGVAVVMPSGDEAALLPVLPALPALPTLPASEESSDNDVRAALITIRDRGRANRYRSEVYAALRTIEPEIERLDFTKDGLMVIDAAIKELFADGKITTVNFGDLVDAASEIVGKADA